MGLIINYLISGLIVFGVYSGVQLAVAAMWTICVLCLFAYTIFWTYPEEFKDFYANVVSKFSLPKALLRLPISLFTIAVFIDVERYNLAFTYSLVVLLGWGFIALAFKNVKEEKKNDSTKEE